MMFIKIMTCYAQYRVKAFIIIARFSYTIIYTTMGIETKNYQLVLSRRTLDFQDSVEVYNCTHTELGTNHHTHA